MKARHYLISVVFIAVAFFAGSAWKSTDSGKIVTTETSKSSAGLNNSDQANFISTEQTNLSENELATIHLFEDAAPSVVFITTISLRRDYWSRNVMEVPSGTGSGFIWSKEGEIVTNFHVLGGGKKFIVTLADQSTYEATVVGVAPSKDLAVLKIDAPRGKLTPISIGRSDNLQVGQSVYAIGNPFGLDQTLTTGIISALGREIESMTRTPIRDVIQTDAAINPGNSGGPLLNSSGQLIGVNTQIYSPSGASAGIGFSIPVDAVNWVIPELIKYGELRRPLIGVELVSQNNVKKLGLEGALILNTSAGGPAANAGLRSTKRDQNGNIIFGDLIIALEGNPIKSNNDLVLALEKFEAGDNVNVRVVRDEKELVIPVKLQSSKHN